MLSNLFRRTIVGAMAALEYRSRQDMAAWTAEQDRKVNMILDRLTDIPGVGLNIDPDPNGCPFSRARITLDPAVTAHTAESLRDALADGDPTIVVRAHHAEEGYINIDAIEMTDEEIDTVCSELKRHLSNDS